MANSDEERELQEYVSSALKSIKNGVNDNKDNFRLEDDIEFELAIVNTKSAGGGFKIIVANAEGKIEKEKISKIKFKIKPNKDWGTSYVAAGTIPYAKHEFD
jgi:hypothetical protein